MGRRAGVWAGLAFAALGLAGCGSGGTTAGGAAQPAGKSFPDVALNVAVLGDGAEEAVGVLNAQRGEWEASRGGRITIEAADDVAKAAAADLIVFAGDRLGDLIDADALAEIAEGAVRPPKPVASASGPENEAKVVPPPDEYAFDQVAPAFRDEGTRYGPTRVGLPVGGSALVLVYRRDAFDNEANRKAAEDAGLALEPPKTWAQLDALAAFFQGRDWDGDGQPESGVALAWGDDPEGVGDAVYLSRAAASGQRSDQYSFLFDAETMEPRLTTPPFVEALEGLTALVKSGPEGAAGFDADAAREAYRTGRVALLIDRAERSTTWIQPDTAVATALAALPGSERVYDPTRKIWEGVGAPNRPTYLPRGGGWLAGVGRKAEGTKADAALDLAKYLTSADVTARMQFDPAWPLLPVRNPQVGAGPANVTATPGLDGRSWSTAVGQELAAPRVVPGLRIPGARDYLADLAKARVAAATGEQPAESALQATAEAWTARTEQIGKARQKWHYRRSLLKYPTTDRPPPAAGAATKGS